MAEDYGYPHPDDVTPEVQKMIDADLQMDKRKAEADRTRTKCTVVNDTLECCASLDRALEDGSMRKGVTYLQLYDIETVVFSRSGAVLRSGEFAKNGVIMNYCPFCGASIAEHFKVKEPTPSEGGTT